jgi:hypothetical protein
MNIATRCALLSLGLAGCFDLSVLQSGANPPDLALPEDMASPPVDMAKPPADMATPDMANPDMATPPVWGNVTPATAPAKLYGISGVTAGGTVIYAVGAAATVLKSTDKMTFVGAAVPAAGTTDFSALWVRDAMNLYVADTNGKVFASSDGAATAANWADKATNSTFPQRAIYGRSGADSLVVAGDDTSRALLLTPLSSTTWSATMSSCTGGVKTLGVWGSTNYYVLVGEGLKAAKGGNPAMTACTALQPMSITGSPNLVAVSGFNDQNAWLISADGQLIHADLTAANDKMNQRGVVANATFAALWVRSANDVWIAGSVGGSPKIWQWNSNTMSDRTSNLSTLGAGYTLTGIWGDGTGAVWIIGNNATNGAIFKR